MNNVAKVFSLLFVFLLGTKNVFGYIDAGTGSYILQIMAAGFFAGLYLAKVYWAYIVSFCKKIVSLAKGFFS